MSTAPISTGAPASTGAVSSGITTGGSTGAPASRWNDNWRTLMAEGSTDVTKELEQLGRYESPEQVWKKARALEKRMSAGELRTALPANATSQEVAAWRKENGIPAEPAGYKLNLPQGVEPPKEDDAFLKAFLKGAHDANYNQAQVDAGLALFYAEVNRSEDAFKAAEDKAAQEADDKLHEVWGRDYRLNKQLAENLLARAPKGFRDRFLNGYLADHTPIRADVGAWQWLVQLEREANPAATVVPNMAGDPAKGVAERLQELRTMMGNQQGPYWKGEKADALQAEYRSLLEAEDRLKQRTKAAA